MDRHGRLSNDQISRRKFLLAYAGVLTTTLAGCVGVADDETVNNGSDSETSKGSENLNDPASAVEEYIGRFYSGDVEWVNNFHAEDGKKKELSSSDAEKLEQIEVNIEKVEVVEETDTEATVQATLELISEDVSATATREFELRQIGGEWKLWDSKRVQEGINVSEIDFAHPEFGSGIETIVTIENHSERRINVNVVVEIYDENLLVDDISMWVEIPPETTVKEDGNLTDLDDPERVTHYVVKGKVGYGGELSTIFEHDGELLREALN